jgi:ActR/RegA family two-component response regulator
MGNTMLDVLSAIGTIITILVALSGLYNWYKKRPKSVLFIDDEINDFEIVNTLKQNKFNIETMEDVEDLEDEKIKKAKIIFVDFKGVGKKFGKHQGIDLIKALKSKYKNKKSIILFSAHSGFSLSHDLKAGDDSIAKNASTQDFINIINKYL